MNEYEEGIELWIQFISTLAKNDEFFSLSAKIIKKMTDALVAEGFTREEAVSIAAHYQGASAK